MLCVRLLSVLMAADLLAVLQAIVDRGRRSSAWSERRPGKAEQVLDLLYRARLMVEPASSGLPVISLHSGLLASFRRWLVEKERVEERTANDYVSALERLGYLDEEKAIEALGNDKAYKAARKLVRFLYEKGRISKDAMERYLSLLKRRTESKVSERVEVDWAELVSVPVLSTLLF